MLWLFDSVNLLVLLYDGIFPYGYRIRLISTGLYADALDRIIVSRVHFIPHLSFDVFDFECSGDAAANVRANLVPIVEHLVVSADRTGGRAVRVGQKVNESAIILYGACYIVPLSSSA